ncbi:MAG: endonuclease/exonuclease/phosphatase [Acidobacteria bacterium]|nr:endonuclease/exonuclease/phosphatase [Acidobacteriota bacterium]
MIIYNLHRLLAISIVVLAFAYGSTISAQQRLTVVSWNVQSGQADPQRIAPRVRAFQDVDIWGFSEVQNDAAAAVFETAAEAGENADFRRVVGTTGGADRLVIIYDSNRFSKIRDFQLNHINSGGHRAPLVAQLRETSTGQELLFMVNHLARGNSSLRHRQAGQLRRWAENQVLPVIAVGDYNFDWSVEGGDADHDLGYDRMTQDDIFTWVRPERLIKSQCSEEFDSVLDFVFVSSPAQSWPATSEIIVVPGDCPDDNETPDHRPVIAKFEMQEATPLDLLMTIQPSLGVRPSLEAVAPAGTRKQQLLQRIEALEAEMRAIKELIKQMP